jgi:hypothetical protein
MTAQETRNEIRKILEEIPEESLSLILDYLKDIKKLTSSQLKTNKNLMSILREDRGLLKRLAQ